MIPAFLKTIDRNDLQLGSALRAARSFHIGPTRVIATFARHHVAEQHLANRRKSVIESAISRRFGVELRFVALSRRAFE